jgi:hypothetical protein
MKRALKTSIFSLKNNRKIKIFLLFLVLTSIIWLLVELSKNSTSTVNFKVQYKNIPTDKLFQNTPVSELDVVIKAPGFSLLRYKTKQHKITLSLSKLVKKNNFYYLLPNQQLSLLKEQFPFDVEVLNILNDTIYFELENNITKKIPVHLNIDVKFKLGYNFIDNLKCKPDSIEATGPKKYMDSIFEIDTYPLKLTEVYENIDTALKLKKPFNNDHVKWLVDKIQVTGKVDKFTEGRIKVPVKIINEPAGVKLNPFPKEIEVVYQVGLSHFNKINEDSFSVVFDYNQYGNDTTVRYLQPVINQKSDLLFSVKIIPNQIEFLIQN